jgi:hypothetical protein
MRDETCDMQWWKRQRDKLKAEVEEAERAPSVDVITSIELIAKALEGIIKRLEKLEAKS